MLPGFWGPMGCLFLGWGPNLNPAPCSLALSPGFCSPSPSRPPSPGQSLADGRRGRWASGLSAVMAAITKASPCPRMALPPAFLIASESHELCLTEV